MTLVRVGGLADVVVSVGLAVVVIVRDTGLNVVNGWTIALGIGAGMLAFAAHRTLVAVAAAVILTGLAMLPALTGGLGLLYVAPIALLVVGSRRITDESPSAAARKRRGRVPRSHSADPNKGHDHNFFVQHSRDVFAD